MSVIVEVVGQNARFRVSEKTVKGKPEISAEYKQGSGKWTKLDLSHSRTKKILSANNCLINHLENALVEVRALDAKKKLAGGE